MNSIFSHCLRLVFAVALTCGLFISSMAAVIYVNPAAAGANDGTSWANGFTSLSAALAAAASGDEIWVAQGTYKPDIQVDVNGSGGSDPREVTFQIPGGVMLYGGFDGTEITRSERDWVANRTILSGDIDNNDVLTDGITYEVDDIVGANAYHIVYTVNVDANTRLDGFIINAGSASITVPLNAQDPNLDGGGWYNDLEAPSFSSSPTIANTLFQGNYAASEGGGFFCNQEAIGGEVLSLIWHCDFKRNESGITGGGLFVGSFNPGNYAPVIRGGEFWRNEAYRRGGGMYLLGDHSVVDSLRFIFNKTNAISPDASTLPGSGGAVNMVASNASFSTCYFENNISTGNPTGPYEGGGGGAVYMSANEPQTSSLGPSEPSFFNCGFYVNVASGNGSAWGGAAVHLSDAGILRPHYVNCLFASNQAQNHGGAIANFTRVISAPGGFTPALEPQYTNCTFTQNFAGQRGGALYNDGYEVMGVEFFHGSAVNDILWDNLAAAEGSEVYNLDGSMNFSYSLIEGSGGSGGGWNPSIGTDGGNNIDVNPGFVNQPAPLGADNILGTNDDGLRLIPSSSAISAGNSAASGLIGVTIDLRGGPRILGPSVDMGSYENTGIVIPDFDIYSLEPWKPVDPPCLTCPWAIILTDRFFSRFDWDGPAQFIDYGKYGIITGKIINTLNRKITFDVYMKLEAPQDWANWNMMNRTWKVYTPAALRVALRSHFQWTYWELSDESYLQGTGVVSGMLHLRHFPLNYKTGFQVGGGANGWDGDFGIGGSFAYYGRLQFGQQKYALKGTGGLNVDAALCKSECVPLIEKANSYEELALLPDVYGPTGTSFVYPNPAHDKIIIQAQTIEGTYMISLYDQYGQLRQSDKAASSDGMISLPLKEQLPGIYYLRLVSSTGETQNQKIIIE
jgi:Secretion system C-terminal sorting domain/Chlamydia polymorphic membrane protein (Chlamydia_PMP) repeat